jgi:rare lipoprotein A
MKKLNFLAAIVAVFGSTVAQARTITATVYHQDFAGQPDYCSGRPFRYWGISAAHPWLPCGTLVTVTHKGRSLVVPIKDRCDCDSIDLSAGAAYRLGIPLDGIGRVQVRY